MTGASVARAERTFTALDGDALEGTVFGDVERRNADGTGAPIVVVAGATAVPARFYQRFAEHLAARGLAVVTFDYRGIGRSKRGSLRDSRATFDDWADNDLAAVIAWALERGKVGVVGHSFGGQAFGLLDRANETLGLYGFGIGAGWTGYIPTMSERMKVRLYWRLLAPASARIFGYLPSRIFGMGEDLPDGVFRQWREWCSRPRYYFDVPDDGARYAARVARVKRSVVSVSASDDLWASPASARALFSGFTGCAVDFRSVVPSAGSGPIGHMGYFRPSAAHLWDDPVDWFRARVATAC